MQSYPVEIDPDQVVRWILAEHEAAPATFRITGRRKSEAREIPVRKEDHLGDEEREDIREIATIATLEIAPAHANDGWLLTVVVEDELGPRMPEKALTEGDEQGIDMSTFYREFIRSGRGTASIIAEVEDSAAEARMADLLDAIGRNVHGPAGSGLRG